MKLLKIEESGAMFLNGSGQYTPVDQITKDDLLRLVEHVLGNEPIELDEYAESSVKNQAHQVIYKSVHRKLSELLSRRSEFVDESARLFLEDYQRYQES